MASKLNELQLLILEKERIECQDVEDLLDDLVEGTLPPTLRARVDAHVRSCHFCQEVEDGYRLTIDLAREIGENTPPISTDVQNRLRKALNARLGIALPLVNGE